MEIIRNVLKKAIPELFGEGTVFRVIYEEKSGRRHTVYILGKNQKEVMKKLRKYKIVEIKQYDTQLGVGA